MPSKATTDRKDRHVRFSERKKKHPLKACDACVWVCLEVFDAIIPVCERTVIEGFACLLWLCVFDGPDIKKKKTHTSRG